MRRSPSWPFVIGIALCLASLVAAQETEEKYKELPNFRAVNPTVFRGGQPQKGGLKKLSEMGIKTVINLRNADELAKAEEAEARAVGLQYFNIPLNKFDRPSDAHVNQILTLLTSAENQPIFVHCKRGSDRTGTVIAIYRISFEGWTGEQATDEAKRYGLGFWQYKMKDYISDYYKRQNK